MNRREAMLREFNLYPLWQLRKNNSEAVGDTAASPPPVGAGFKPARLPHVATNMPANAASPDNSPPECLDVTAAAVALEDTGKSREQRISELDWTELKAMVRDCTACKLRAGCTQTVFGVGDEQADWLFVGEGPGAEEDAQGEPFVGQAGKLLDNMLAAIKLKRGNNVYIANIVKCRPPDNRNPQADEIAQCLPYLQRQIALIQPKLIVALGKTAATALLGKEATLGSLRGKLHDYNGIPLLVTYHPAYLLRSPMEKAKAWEDLCFALRVQHGEGA